MQTKRLINLALAAMLFVVGLALPADAAPPPVAYQGQLKFNGVPYDGLADFSFALYDRLTDGTRLCTYEQYNVDVDNGLFTVEMLMDGTDCFNGEERWLEVWVRTPGDSATLDPRQRVTFAPYALYALDAPGGSGLWLAAGSDIYYKDGKVGVGLDDPSYPLHVADWSGVPTVVGDNRSAATQGQLGGESAGVYGVGTGSSNAGVFGVAENGYGVKGEASGIYGVGVDGYTWSPTGAAIHGHNEADSGNAIAIWGDTGSPDGFGGYFNGKGYFQNELGVGVTDPAEMLDVAGTIQATGFKLTTAPAAGWVLTSNATGIGTWQPSGGGGSSYWSIDPNDNIFYSDGNVGIGFGTGDPPLYPLHVTTYSGHAIVGQTTATSGSTSGVYGKVVSPGGHGVYGQATGTGGRGVYGESPNGNGVEGYTENSTASAVYGLNEAGTGNAVGVRGDSYSTFGRGVHGMSTGNGGIGVFGEVTGTSGYGMWGTAANGIGVFGESNAASDGKGVEGWIDSSTGIGVLGSNDASTGDAIAVKGRSGHPNGYGGYFEGRGYFSRNLDVDGQVTMAGLKLGTSATAGHVLTTDASGVGTWQTPTGGGSTHWEIDPDDSLYYNNGYVRIGGGDAMSTLQELHVEGNGYFRDNVGIGVPSPTHPLHVVGDADPVVSVESTSTVNFSSALAVQTGANEARAVYGHATAASGGNASGGYFESDSIYGHAVRGKANATEGAAIGGFFTANAPDAKGIVGRNDSDTGSSVGVQGYTESNSGRAVFGWAAGSEGESYAVYGQNASPDGYGGYFNGKGYFSGNVGIGVTPDTTPLIVDRPSGTGAGPAITGQAAGSSTTGVYGLAADPVESCTGVRGESTSPAGYGIQGRATADSGINVGVRGQSSSPDGRGIEGVNYVGGWAGYFQGRTYISARLGIGTDDPLEPLDVAGTARMTGFKLTTAPSDGYVLTSDGSGVGTWEPGGFTLPYDGTITDTGTAFKITNTGTGMGAHAIFAEIPNASSSDAVAGYFTSQGGSGKALRALSDGGTAIVAQNNGGTTTLDVKNSGTGNVIEARAGSDLVFKVAGTGITHVNVLAVEGGADLAERFDIGESAKPGMVVEIDPDHTGKLRVARDAYSRRVAGVISGANGVDAGMILGDLPGDQDTEPVALSGRVWVHCDATRRPIGPGDLLTTAERPGHAMAVADYDRAQGAVLGKAMSSLDEGTGLVLVLVSLQ